jgi:translation initiation factor 1
MTKEKSKLVYSTEQAVPRKEKPAEKDPDKGLRPVLQKVTVRLDRKARGGKSVTVIEGLSMAQKDMEALLKQLKAGLGTGGTLTDACLEIQGDHREALMLTLQKMGYYRPKRSGG